MFQPATSPTAPFGNLVAVGLRSEACTTLPVHTLRVGTLLADGTFGAAVTDDASGGSH